MALLIRKLVNKKAGDGLSIKMRQKLLKVVCNINPKPLFGILNNLSRNTYEISIKKRFISSLPMLSYAQQSRCLFSRT